LVLAYSTKTVKDMDEETKQRIIDAGVPLECYTDGRITLGPINKSSITKYAIINTLITQHDLPLPPSKFYEKIVEKCNNKHDKQDFREIIDGQPGYGKSYSGMFGCERYAYESAAAFGQDPKDYFSLDNCALLQDTEGVTSLLDRLDKYQAVFIDDAGVSAGHKDFATQSNKNLDAIMATCRTKRWYVVFTAPMSKHLDLSIREVVYCKSTVFKPCHEAGFNIIKHKSINYQEINGKFKEYKPNFIFDDIKISLYAAFSPDSLDAYKGIVAKYDAMRDKAADSLIHDRAEKERDAKQGTTKREKKFDSELQAHKDKIYKMTHDENGKWLQRRAVGFSKSEGTYSMRQITSEVGLSEHKVNMIIAHIKQEEGNADTTRTKK
jgi:hypothetical protein